MSLGATTGRTFPTPGREWVRRVLVWLPLALLLIWTALPILMTLSISFKTRADVFAAPQLIPPEPTLEAYRSVINRQGFRGAFVNSVVVGLGTALLTLVVAVPAAYAFARFRFRGRHLLLLFTLIPRLIPGLGLMVPLYRLAAALGAIDKRSTLIVVFTGTVLPLTQTPGKRTLPYELWLMTDTTGFQDNPGQAAFAMLTLVPFVFLYLRIERYVVGGITSGAVK